MKTLVEIPLLRWRKSVTRDNEKIYNVKKEPPIWYFIIQKNNSFELWLDGFKKEGEYKSLIEAKREAQNRFITLILSLGCKLVKPEEPKNVSR